MEVNRDKLLNIIETLENHRTRENDSWLRLVLKDLYGFNKVISEPVDLVKRYMYAGGME